MIRFTPLNRKRAADFTDHKRLADLATQYKMSSMFTLREFARLSWEAPEAKPVGLPTDEGLRVRVAAIARQRGLTRRARPGEYDVADPYGKPLEVARATVAQISLRVDIAVRELGLSRTGDPQIGG